MATIVTTSDDDDNESMMSESIDYLKRHEQYGNSFSRP